MLRKIGLPMLCLFSLPAAAELTPQDFHRAVYALQQQQIAQHEIRTAEETGDYEGAAAARYRYVDTRYYDAASGRLLSHVRRDADTPEHVHIVEVNVYEQGKLVRDFGSLTLPWAPLQPTRTFINFHHYNGKLHSFRQYDFYGDVGYESCTGELAGKPVRIALDDKDLLDAANTATPEYKACFDGMRSDWERYLTPH